MVIKDLLELGKRNGYVTIGEFKSALPPEINYQDQIQDIIEYLRDLGIEIRGTSAEVIQLFKDDEN